MGSILLKTQASALLLALALAAPLCAQGFDAVDFFGPDYTPATERSDNGVLSNSLREAAPAWLDYSCSDDARARDRFAFSDAGLQTDPGGKHTCEALLDIGVTEGTCKLTLTELVQGGSFGWHLREMTQSGSAWLVEVKHQKDGFELRIRVPSRGGYTTIPGSKVQIADLKLPAIFELTIKTDKLVGSIGGKLIETKVEIKHGIGIGLATTNDRSRIRDLSIDARLNPDWVADAQARLLARRTLQRLREYATVGLLHGIAAYPHPDLAKALESYSEAERASRKQAHDAAPPTRAKALRAIADAHPNSAAAQHEAGIAALLAGSITEAQRLLLAADKLQRTPVTSLALAEACRRVGEPDAAGKALDAAAVDLPEALRPDRALLEGRLMADRGDIATARRILGEAARKYPDNVQLNALSDSANALLEPQTLRVSDQPGPLGLQVWSDLPEESLKPMLAALKPYIEQIRTWLPDLKEKLDGVLAIYASPIEYLRAALLVAGDNLDNIAGMYMAHGIGNGPSVVVCRAFGENELQRTLVHELWHLALASTGRGKTTPRWLDEGMAVFLSAGKYENQSMSYTSLPSEFGGIDSPVAQINVARLDFALAARAQEFYLPSEVRGNYLAAWAVVWFYARRGTGLQFLRDLLRGDAEAFKRINADHDKLQQELAKALKDAMG